MGAFRGLLGLVLLLAIAFALSRDRMKISWRTVVAALVLQFAFAALVLRFGPGEDALSWVSDQVERLIGFTQEGTSFVFGPLLDVGGSTVTIFALQVLPVIIFLGALIFLLVKLRVVQFLTYYIGGAIGWVVKVTRIEAVFAATVVFLGASEAPLLISPFLRRMTSAQLFLVITGGLTAASGSTLVGYALLGAPLPYLIAATVMNAPAAILFAKMLWPDTVREPVVLGSDRMTIGAPAGPDPAETALAGTAPRTEGATGATAASVTNDSEGGRTGDGGDPADEDADGDDDADHGDVRKVKDDESANAIDAIGRGALAGGQIAVTVGALLIAFVALIALANAILGGIGSWFGAGDLTLQQILGWVLSPVTWLLGVPWSEAGDAGAFIGIKTVLNEFVAYGQFGPQVDSLAPVTVVVVTFALAGFANFGSIAIMIGTLGSLVPELRSFVARVGLRALLAATLANLSNAAIAGLLFMR